MKYENITDAETFHMPLMRDVVFYNVFYKKILIKSYKYDGLIPFHESLFRCIIDLILRIIHFHGKIYSNYSYNIRKFNTQILSNIAK